jgi:hypothetical protein
MIEQSIQVLTYAVAFRQVFVRESLPIGGVLSIIFFDKLNNLDLNLADYLYLNTQLLILLLIINHRWLIIEYCCKGR